MCCVGLDFFWSHFNRRQSLDRSLGLDSRTAILNLRGAMKRWRTTYRHNLYFHLSSKSYIKQKSIWFIRCTYITGPWTNHVTLTYSLFIAIAGNRKEMPWCISLRTLIFLFFVVKCCVVLLVKQFEAFWKVLSLTVLADRLSEGQRGQSKATFPLSALALGSSWR